MTLINQITAQFAEGSGMDTDIEKIMTRLSQFESLLGDMTVKLQQIKQVETFTAFKKLEIGPKTQQLTFWTQKFKHKVFDIDLDSDGTYTEHETQRLDFEGSTSIHCQGKLLAFTNGRPVKVWSHENAHLAQKIVKNELQALPLMQHLSNFALCTIRDKYVLLTGG